MPKHPSWIISILLFLSLVNGDFIHVPDAQPTIQDGLNVALEGDTVLVAPGTYYENIVWPSMNGIDLLSDSGPEVTIIDGN